MTLPAALSILTTTFAEGKDRHTALGVWGGVGGLASAVGVLLGGVLTRRARLALGDVRQPDRLRARPGRSLPADRGERRARAGSRTSTSSARCSSPAGCCCWSTRWSKAPTVGWGDARARSASSRGALALLARVRGQRAARTATRWRRCRSSASTGLAFADVTQLIAFAGFLAMFFFLTLYMQNVLGYSRDQDRRSPTSPCASRSASRRASRRSCCRASAPGR